MIARRLARLLGAAIVVAIGGAGLTLPGSISLPSHSLLAASSTATLAGQRQLVEQGRAGGSAAVPGAGGSSASGPRTTVPPFTCFPTEGALSICRPACSATGAPAIVLCAPCLPVTEAPSVVLRCPPTTPPPAPSPTPRPTPTPVPPAPVVPPTISFCPVPQPVQVGPSLWQTQGTLCGGGFKPREIVTITLRGLRGTLSWQTIALLNGTFRTPVPFNACQIEPLAVMAAGNRGSVSNVLPFPRTSCHLAT